MDVVDLADQEVAEADSAVAAVVFAVVAALDTTAVIITIMEEAYIYILVLEAVAVAL